MNNFLDNYENVKSRKQRFYNDYKDGRIIVTLENEDIEEKALFRAIVYLNKEDQEKNLPRATGYALEIRDKEKSKNKYGKEFESVNFSSWTENAEESAVGRALDNAGYASNGKCSREEIEKSQRMASTLADSPIQKKEDNIQEFSSNNLTNEKLATEAQRKLLWAIAKKNNIGEVKFREILAQFGYKSSKEIKFTDVNKIKEALEK